MSTIIFGWGRVEVAITAGKRKLNIVELYLIQRHDEGCHLLVDKLQEAKNFDPQQSEYYCVKN